jgi:hypothetical protein
VFAAGVRVGCCVRTNRIVREASRRVLLSCLAPLASADSAFSSPRLMTLATDSVPECSCHLYRCARRGGYAREIGGWAKILGNRLIARKGPSWKFGIAWRWECTRCRSRGSLSLPEPPRRSEETVAPDGVMFRGELLLGRLMRRRHVFFSKTRSEVCGGRRIGSGSGWSCSWC